MKFAPSVATTVAAKELAARLRSDEGQAAPSAQPKRGRWAGGGPDNYVRPDLMPDALNKSTKEWWAEVEKGVAEPKV